MQTRTAADNWTIGPLQYWLLQKCLLNCYLKSHHLLFIQQIEQTLWDLNLDPCLRHCNGTICFIAESLSLRFLEQNLYLVLVPRTKLTQSKSSLLLILRGFQLTRFPFQATDKFVIYLKHVRRFYSHLHLAPDSAQ